MSVSMAHHLQTMSKASASSTIFITPDLSTTQHTTTSVTSATSATFTASSSARQQQALQQPVFGQKDQQTHTTAQHVPHDAATTPNGYYEQAYQQMGRDGDLLSPSEKQAAMLTQPTGGDHLYAYRVPLPEPPESGKIDSQKPRAGGQRKMVKIPGTKQTYVRKDANGRLETARFLKH